MNFKSLVAQLANRINQPYVVETYMRTVFASGVEWQKKQSPWINVKERLPEVETSVFFTVEWKDLHKGYFVGEYSYQIHLWGVLLTGCQYRNLANDSLDIWSRELIIKLYD